MFTKQTRERIYVRSYNIARKESYKAANSVIKLNIYDREGDIYLRKRRIQETCLYFDAFFHRNEEHVCI